MKPAIKPYEREVPEMVIRKVSKKPATTCKCKGSC